MKCQSISERLRWAGPLPRSAVHDGYAVVSDQSLGSRVVLML